MINKKWNLTQETNIQREKVNLMLYEYKVEWTQGQILLAITEIFMTKDSTKNGKFTVISHERKMNKNRVLSMYLCM